jgi:serine/threonine-protein kinase
MSPAQWSQVKEIFHAAVELAPTARAALLRERCGGDAELLREMQLLFASHDEAQDFIEEPALASASALLSGDEDGLLWGGRMIGPYRVLRELGRGGMGLVLLAERDDDQFRKQVAIKLVRRGLGTDDILRRFRHERQILASLNHPNIANVFDGGTTDAGQPYLVMEYVEGLPLLEYCAARRLPTDERLRLFRSVCAAVEHAHQRLVVHRDLKPSNILVTNAGEVKLLDFGIAKLLDAQGTPASELTATAARALTPQYASPEQLRGERVTTATDIYSLGVILYELLTDARPYKLKDASPLELARAICDTEPTKPSQAAAGRGVRDADSTKPSSNPQPAVCNPKSLRGDLDNIVLTALRKDPARRYRSVEQFSEDIRRHLAGLPVTARKDSFTYRASKFVGRNRVGVAAACLLCLTLVGGTAATAWQARLASVKSAEAQAALRRSEKIDRFMQTIFSYANPQWFGRAGGRRDVSVLEAMRDVESRVEAEFPDEPDVRADVYQQIGDAYRTQGLAADAERALRAALRLRRELYGEDSAKVAESLFILSGVRHQQDDAAGQESLLAEALAIQRRHPEEGNNLPYMLTDYAAILGSRKGDCRGAVALNLEAMALYRRRYGDAHYMITATHRVLGSLYTTLGDYPQAEAHLQEVLKRPQDGFNAEALLNLASIRGERGDYQAADDLIRRAPNEFMPQPQAAIFPARLAETRSRLAYRRGDYAQAQAEIEQAVAAPTKNESEDGGDVLLLAQILNRRGQPQRAEALSRSASAALCKTADPENPLQLAALDSVLGESLAAENRFAEAEPLLLSAYEAQRARLLPQSSDLTETRRRLAELYREWDKAYEAKKYE